jgi:hypothetical protein
VGFVIFVVNRIGVWKHGNEQRHSTTKNTNFTQGTTSLASQAAGYLSGAIHQIATNRGNSARAPPDVSTLPSSFRTAFDSVRSIFAVKQ